MQYRQTNNHEKNLIQTVAFGVSYDPFWGHYCFHHMFFSDVLLFESPYRRMFARAVSFN